MQRFLSINSSLQNVSIGLMLPEGVPYLENRIGYGSSAGALVLAMKRIEREQLLPDVQFQ